MRNLDPARARWIRARMGLLCSVMALGLAGVMVSAWQVQVDDGPRWREIAEKQRQRRLHTDPKRGTILDRNGTPLAVSVDVPSVSADVGEMLRAVEDHAQQESVLRDAAARIGRALTLPPDEVYAKLEPRHRFVWLKRGISADEAASVRDLGDPKKQQSHVVRGLAIEGEGRRYYPSRELAGPLLGFVAPDGLGKEGLELALEEDLHGHVADLRGLRDRGGRLILEEAGDEHAVQGNDVFLTIDEGIQHVAERELETAMHTYETKGGSLVVVDPFSGELLAVANVPGYNPNDYGESPPDARRDRAVTDRFEPGSVMKPFLMAGALAAGTVQPTETINCEHGVYRVGGITVHDTHQNDLLTPTQILAKSSNIGALKIGLRLGEAALYANYRRFGFGEASGVSLPGEAGGTLRPRGRPWYDAETASASFGQGISVTALQLAMAMSAIANGGKLLEPILVKRVVDGRGDVVREANQHPRQDVVPAGVARTVTEMLTAVTEEGGTAVEAAIPGFRVAGKTSTAQKVDPATGRYSNEKYTAVFVGFVPVERPRLVVAVVLDEPMIGHYGGDLAGPVFRRVAEASLRYLGVAPPSHGPIASWSERPSDRPDAGGAAPPRAPASPPDERPASATAEVSHVPDATGMGAHEVVVLLTRAGLVPEVEGWGRAVRQDPPAGTLAPRGSPVHVVLQPAS